MKLSQFERLIFLLSFGTSFVKYKEGWNESHQFKVVWLGKKKNLCIALFRYLNSQYFVRFLSNMYPLHIIYPSIIILTVKLLNLHYRPETESITTNWKVPDRVTGYTALQELNPNRRWNFIEVYEKIKSRWKRLKIKQAIIYFPFYRSQFAESTDIMYIFENIAQY